MRRLILGLIAITFALTGCSQSPTPVAPTVKQFDAQRYLGKWYEILRLPHGFEENLQGVTAEYRLNADGSLEVTNRGYNEVDGEWQTAIGRAEPVANMQAAYRVTFFWPFDGGYYVSWLDSQYQHAIVTSDSHDYFWFLSRSPDVPQDLIDLAIAQANEWGFASDQLIRVKHPAGAN